MLNIPPDGQLLYKIISVKFEKAPDFSAADY